MCCSFQQILKASSLNGFLVLSVVSRPERCANKDEFNEAQNHQINKRTPVYIIVIRFFLSAAMAEVEEVSQA